MVIEIRDVQYDRHIELPSIANPYAMPDKTYRQLITGKNMREQEAKRYYEVMQSKSQEYSE